MKEITQLVPNIYEVISEPGDATRYEYLVYRDGPDEFTFCPTRNTFNYPQRLSFWDVNEISQASIVVQARLFNCNPYTFEECVRTILELHKNSTFKEVN